MVRRNLHFDVCELAKHTRTSFSIINKRIFPPFYLIYSDIWGLFLSQLLLVSRWFVFFIDYCRVSLYMLKHTLDVSSVLPIFHSMIQNWFGTKIKRFW